ncbi:hypothetical protein [Nocardia sp. NPDC052112]|uniref:hypothetical protein n=1 Tax=Nocardia sp. NPDC052112 TaxID=3155646 RepID=UPI00343F9D2E
MNMMIGKLAKSAVLSVLAPGGMLSASQITAQARLTTWTARRAIGHLSACGLIMASPYQARYSITPRGLVTLSGMR